MTSVLIVDDQDLVRTGFRLIVEAAGMAVVGEAGDGSDAVDLARELRPDVVLMDVRMPRMDGIEATRLIRKEAGDDTSRRVLVLTTFDLDEYVFDALCAGASGFLLKDAPRQQLIDAIGVVAAGEALLAPSVTRRLIEEFSAARRRTPPAARRDDPALATLTARERETLELIAKGLTNAEIAAAMYVGEATVKTHVGNVLMKLAMRDRVQAVIYAYQHGIVDPHPT